eukprot:1401573-Pyramimonas_sp.AAC.1
MICAQVIGPDVACNIEMPPSERAWIATIDLLDVHRRQPNSPCMFERVVDVHAGLERLHAVPLALGLQFPTRHASPLPHNQLRLVHPLAADHISALLALEFLRRDERLGLLGGGRGVVRTG